MGTGQANMVDVGLIFKTKGTGVAPTFITDIPAVSGYMHTHTH